MFPSIKPCGANFLSFPLNFYIDRTYFTVYYGRSFPFCYDILVYKTVCLSKGWFYSVKDIPYNRDQLIPQGAHEDASMRLSV